VVVVVVVVGTTVAVIGVAAAVFASSHQGGLRSLPGQSVWNLWCTA